MSLQTDYIKHALEIIRVSNGLRQDANVKVRDLATKLRKLLAGEDLANLSFPALRRLLNEADDIAFAMFQELHGTQSSAVADLITIEAQWAQKTGNYDRAASETRLAQTVRNFTVAGNTIGEQIDTMYNRFRMDMMQQVRLGAIAGQTDREIAARVVGTGADFSGGSMQKTLGNINAVIEAQVQAAADAGRRAALATNGINALMYHAILDSKVCPSCGERDGMFYTIDGEPIGHDIAYLPIPLHPWCRCIYVPQDIPTGAMGKIKASTSFQKFLDGMSEDEQNGILGNGRAALWRDGTITLQDLIGQNGLVLTLKELRAQLDQ